jgi:hypothetical protein
VRECFVIMPIGSGDAYQVYRNRYDQIIRPAVDDLRIDGEPVFRCVRADFVTKTGSITRDLLGRLYRADTVIADLTDLNPNVFYELGVRHTLRARTILMALGNTPPIRRRRSSCHTIRGSRRWREGSSPSDTGNAFIARISR